MVKTAAQTGDRFIIEIDSAFKTRAGYLYTVKGFSSLVFDEYGISKLEPAEGKSELNNKVCEMKHENGKLKAELMRLKLVIETLRNAVTELAKINKIE